MFGANYALGGGILSGPAGIALGGGILRGPAGIALAALGGGILSGPAGIALAVQTEIRRIKMTAIFKRPNVRERMGTLPWR